MRKQGRLTRKISDDELKKRLRACPWCGSAVVSRTRLVTDERTGDRWPAGSFFGCSSFGKTGCDYYVNLNGIERVHPDELRKAA